jgi:anti-sigma B factor antagonist
MRCGIATPQAEVEKPNGQAFNPAIRCEARGSWREQMTRHEEHVLTRVADARAEEVIVVAGAPDDLRRLAALRLSHRILPTGEAIADIGGELDIATADVAVRYVRLMIDRHGGPVIVDLAGLAFCDAQGLSALLRMATYAERAGCPFRLASPRQSLVKIMQITGLDRRFLLRPSGLQSPPYHDW